MCLATLAIDTQIVMIGHGMAGNQVKDATPYKTLLDSFYGKLILALDRHTRQEYEDNMGRESKGREWLMRLAEQDRLQFFQKTPKESAKTKAALRKAGFNSKDWHWIRLALAMDAKLLVAEEPHFTNVAGMLRKNEGITICSAKEACEMICANPVEQCDVAISPVETPGLSPTDASQQSSG